MVEYLFNFLRRNKLEIKIIKSTVQSNIYYGIQFIKSGRISPPISFEYEVRPTPSQIVQDIITSYLEGNERQIIQKAIVDLVGEEEFGKFLDIIEDEQISNVIQPSNGRDRFTVRFFTTSNSVLNSCQIATFSELQHICNDENLKELYIENAEIKNMSFLRSKYSSLSKIKLSSCIIYSLFSLPDVESLILSECDKITSLSNQSPNIGDVSFYRCKIEMQKGEPFLSKSKKIELNSCTISRLDKIFPDSISAISVKLQSLDVKSMFKFPDCPFLESLSIMSNNNLKSLFGLPASFNSLKELTISGNSSLKLIQLSSNFPKLVSLNLNSSQFESGIITNMPKLAYIDVSYNNSCIFDLIQGCKFITNIKANHIRDDLRASSLNQCELLKTINLDGSTIKFDPNTTPSIFCVILTNYATTGRNFQFVGSTIKKTLINDLSHDISINKCDAIDLYDSYIYCTSNLFKSVVEYYNNKSVWALKYIENENEPGLFSQCQQFLESVKTNDRVEVIDALLRQKYKALYESEFSI